MSTPDIERVIETLETEYRESTDDLITLLRISREYPTDSRLREDGKMAECFLTGARRRGQLTLKQTAALDIIELARSV